ncbi:hypothetical protein H1R20_g5595, partial [Candolleomyces eurysporus]
MPSSSSSPPQTSQDVMVLHRIIRFIAKLAAHSFFTEVRVIGGENVPKDGPIIVTATHHNMMLDPVILSVGFPHERMLNYWSKAGLFKHPVAAWILYSSGNIPVDRKSNDRQKLFKGTFQALAKGNAVALFPEGTSYTEPRIMQVKDGAAWAALEYTKWKKDHPELADQPEVRIVPAAIVYTNKSKYRSAVVMEFGKPIPASEYVEQFLSEGEGAARAAVKRMSRKIESELIETTINSPDCRLYTLLILIRDSLAAIIGLPFFFLPLIVHIPAYIMGRIGAKLVEEEEETQAQNKVAFGLISLLFIYSSAFFFLWALFWYTPLGALLSGFLVYLFAAYHTQMIDGNYERAKRFVAAWRVLVGVWTPRRFDLSLSALSQFMTPKTPAPNPWIERPRGPAKSESGDTPLVRSSSLTDLQLQKEPPVKTRASRRPPSRRLVRHVLRARVEAVNALASLFDQLEEAGSQKRIRSSPHLAQTFGETIVAQTVAEGAGEYGGSSEATEGYRAVKEVVAFLRQKGAKIPTLRHGRIQGNWAALSSEGEEYTTSDEKEGATLGSI